MAPKSLNTLPTEVRLQTFKNLLWPNGFICIKYLEERKRFGIATCIRQCEFNMCPLINLSILRTCKRINSECKELLWQRNKLRVRVLTDNLYYGLFYLQYWNLLSRDRSVFFNAGHIELEVELGTSYARIQSYDFPRPFYCRIEKLSRLARIGCLRSIRISFILGESVKRDISDILRRGCHQNIAPVLEVSWRYLTEIRSIRNVFRDHLKHDISEALSERQLFLELGWDIGSVAFPIDFRFKSVLLPNGMSMETMEAIQKEIWRADFRCNVMPGRTCPD